MLQSLQLLSSETLMRVIQVLLLCISRILQYSEGFINQWGHYSVIDMQMPVVVFGFFSFSSFSMLPLVLYTDTMLCYFCFFLNTVSGPCLMQGGLFL